MQRKKKSIFQLAGDKVIARSHYSFAFYTSFAPALIMFSLLCGSLGRGDLTMRPWYYWIVMAFLVLFILGLIYFGIIKVQKGRHHASKYLEPELTTRIVKPPEPDGTYTAALCQNGQPYGHVRVGSISRLMGRRK